MADIPVTGPVITDADYHPDHPGPLGWLIFALHQRLATIEAQLGISANKIVAEVKDAAPGVFHTVEEDVVKAVHKIEDALHISHG